METADTDLSNNFFPRRALPTRFQVFKSGLRSDLEPSAASDAQPVTDASVEGRWNISIAAPGQAVNLELELVRDGDNVTGSVNTPQGKMPISEGTYTNGVLTLKTSTPIELIFSGRIRGSFLSGNVTAPQGTTTFSGAKVE